MGIGGRAFVFVVADPVRAPATGTHLSRTPFSGLAGALGQAGENPGTTRCVALIQGKPWRHPRQPQRIARNGIADDKAPAKARDTGTSEGAGRRGRQSRMRRTTLVPASLFLPPIP